MLGKFLDPKNDVAFRKVFGTEKNKDILIHFLNDVLAFEPNCLIQEVTFLPPNQDPEISVQKTSIVDILCKDQEGKRYIIEMQVAKDKGFEKRAQYYASKAYCSQMIKGGQFCDLKAVIFLAITDFVMFHEKKDYKSEARKVVIDIVSNLLNQGFSIPEIQKITKLSEEELSQLVDLCTTY